MIIVGTEALDLEATAERVAEVRASGASRIGIEVRGTELKRPDLERLAAAGLTGIRVSILGRPPAHDYLVDRPGDFSRGLQTLRVGLGLGLDGLVSTTISRPNFRELRSLPPLLVGASGWLLELPRLSGRTGVDAHLHMPRLGMAIPHALAAVSAARRQGLDAWVRGVPLCLLGPHTGWAITRAGAGFGARCDACRARDACPGVETEYLDRFGDGELGALDAAPPALPASPTLGYLLTPDQGRQA